MADTVKRSTGARFLTLTASFVVVVAGMKLAQPVILPVLFAVFLSILAFPPVRWLRKKRVPLALAILLVLLGGALVLGVLGLLVGDSVREFTLSIPTYRQRLDTIFTSATEWLSARGIDFSRDTLRGAIDAGAAMDVVGATLGAMGTAISNTLLVFLTMVFMLLEALGFPKKLRLALGDPTGDQGWLAQGTREVQRYLYLKTAISFGTGVLITLWVAILGIDFPVLWGLIAFLLNYIPNFGSIIAAVPAVLLALVQIGPGTALAAAAGYVVVNFTIGNVIEPRVMGRTLGVSPLVVFLSLLFWGWLWGPAGMLLSVPLTVVVKILLEHTEDFKGAAVILGPSPDEPEPT